MEKHPRRESSEFKDQFDIAGIFGRWLIYQYFVERTCFVYDGLSGCQKETDKDCKVEGLTAKLKQHQSPSEIVKIIFSIFM